MRKSLLRAIGKKYGRLFIAMLLVSSLGCGLMSGMASGTLSLKNSLEEYISVMEYPDAVITTVVTTRDVMEKIAAVPGIEAVDARLVGNLTLFGKDGSYLSVQAMSYDPGEFQKTYYWEQIDPKGRDSVLLEVGFAKDNDFHAGDLVTVQFADVTRECMIEGIISRPEMLGSRQLNGVEVVSSDVGFLYVPRTVLAKIENPEVTDASAELEVKNQEFEEKQREAKEEHDRAAAELETARTELADRSTELEEKLKEAASAKEDLLNKLAELKEKSSEIDDGEAELLEKQKLLEEKWKELENARKLLEEQKKALAAKRAELDALNVSLEYQLQELTKNLETVHEKKDELAAQKELLLAAKALLEQELKNLTGQETSIEEALAALVKLIDELRQNKELLTRVKGYFIMADFLIKGVQQMDLYEWAGTAVDQLSSMITDSDLVVNGLEQLRTEIKEWNEQLIALEDIGLFMAEIMSMQQNVKDKLASYGITEDQISNLISTAKTYKPLLQFFQNQLATYLEDQTEPERIEELRQQMVAKVQELLDQYQMTIWIADLLFDSLLQSLDDEVLKLSDALTDVEGKYDELLLGMEQMITEKANLEALLAQILSGEKELDALQLQLENGALQIQDGQTAIQNGYTELDGYDQQIKDGEKLLKEQETELTDYQKQLDDAWKKLKDGRRQIADASQQIDDGIREIDQEVTNGKQQYSDAQKRLEEGGKELEKQWASALQEFAEVQKEIERAREQLGEWKGYDEFCNQFLLKISPDADPEQVLAMAIQALGDLEVKDSYTYERSDVHRVMDINVKPMMTISHSLPLFFFAVALIVSFLFMSQLIRQCRREIGILRALGYSKGNIAAYFCVANAIAMIGAIVLGMVIGYCVMRYIGDYFRGFFHLHFMHYALDLPRLWIAVALTLIVGQLATIGSALYISGIQPSEAMLRPIPSKVFFSEGLGKVLGCLSPFVKYSIFSLLRNKLRFVFSVICLSGSVMLIFMSFSFNATKDRILEELFEERILYDCEIFVAQEPDDEWLAGLEQTGYAKNLEKVSYYTMNIAGKDDSVKATVKAVQRDAKLIRNYDDHGKQLSVPVDGILINQKVARKLGASVGDEVSLDGAALKVAAISRQSENQYQVISHETEKRIGEAKLYSVICNVREEDETALMEYLTQDESFLYMAYTRKNYQAMHKMIAPFGTCALIVILFSVVIGLVIVINTFRTNLQEQKKELCMLRTLGRQHAELSLRLFFQAVPYFAFACLIGFPLGVIAIRYVLDKLETSSRTYPFVGDFSIYLLTASVVFAYVTLSHVLSMRAMKKWDIVETVKDKE